MDAYDKAVASLREKSLDYISKAWNLPCDYPEGILFRNASKNGVVSATYGCLTQIRYDYQRGCVSEYAYKAETPELTIAIAQDERIPADADDISKDNLYVFAEWQRRLDASLGRESPVWKEELCQSM